MNLKTVKNMQHLQLNDMEIEYQVIKRKVKYYRLEIKDGNLVLISPYGYDQHEKIIEKHKKWIYKKFTELNKNKNAAKQIKLDFSRNEEEFKDLIKIYIHKFSVELNVEVNSVYFRRMKSRWGSCSSKGNISINRYLIFLPENLIEYLVFHEIAHLIELNHSKQFWAIIDSKFPRYKEIEKELSIYWLAVKETIIDKH